jgi:hypothetical protein
MALHRSEPTVNYGVLGAMAETHEEGLHVRV